MTDMDNDEIRLVVEEQIATVRGAVGELQQVLLKSALMEAYQKGVAPLNEEDANLAGEIEGLESAHSQLKPRLESRHRLLAIEVDQCIVAGDAEGAAVKLAQVEAEEKRLHDLGNEIDRYRARRSAITEEKRGLGKQIFESAYPEFPRATFAMIEATIDLLEGLKKGLFDYVQATDIVGNFPYMLPKQYHLDNLLPSEMPGSDRLLFRRVLAIFGPQRR
jgi:DNA-binding FrmR family transcriptional regulator